MNRTIENIAKRKKTLAPHPNITTTITTTIATNNERIRSDHASEIAEDYSEAILDIIEEKEICRAVDLTRKFRVTHVTVNKTIKRLARDGFVIAEPYSPIELTALGMQTARESRQRHEIVHQFLLSLGVSESTAANRQRRH